MRLNTHRHPVNKKNPLFSEVNRGEVLTHFNVRVCICKVVLNTNTLKNASLEHDHFSLIDLLVQIDIPHCTH